VTPAGAQGGQASRPVRPVTRREVWAWASYDWANSAYSALLITVLAAYLQRVVLPGEPGALAYAWGLGGSMFIAAVLSPVLGAMADARASKRTWLAVTALCGACLGALLGAVPPHYPWLTVGLFFLTSLCFELSFSFYNGFLPEIAGESELNRVSAIGFAMGYVGGGLALAIALGVVRFGDLLGLAGGDEGISLRLRIGLVIMGAWWGIFSLPAILVLRDRSRPRGGAEGPLAVARRALEEVGTTLRNVRVYSMLSVFLLGYLVYNEGIQTVMSQASTFALQGLKMDEGELALLVLFIQFTALPGAMFVGWLSDRIGQKKALMLCLGVWSMILAAAYFVETSFHFWCLGGVVAVVLGGTQSVSRSIMGTMTPPDRSAEFFGFFNLSTRATSMVGPILFAQIFTATGSAHVAILSLLAFILAGWAIVARVDVPRGRLQATAGMTRTAN
jgi:UMF1 family MFS transporter